MSTGNLRGQKRSLCLLSNRAGGTFQFDRCATARDESLDRRTAKLSRGAYTKAWSSEPAKSAQPAMLHILAAMIPHRGGRRMPPPSNAARDCDIVSQHVVSLFSSPECGLGFVRFWVDLGWRFGRFRSCAE